MKKYILKRLIMCLLVIFCASVVIFTIMYFVPGDPVEIMMGANATVEVKNEMREQLDLTIPSSSSWEDSSTMLLSNLTLAIPIPTMRRSWTKC